MSVHNLIQELTKSSFRIRRSTSTLQAQRSQVSKKLSQRLKSSCSRSYLIWLMNADSGVVNRNSSNVMNLAEYVSFVFVLHKNLADENFAAQMARRANTHRHGTCPRLQSTSSSGRPWRRICQAYPTRDTLSGPDKGSGQWFHGAQYGGRVR